MQSKPAVDLNRWTGPMRRSLLLLALIVAAVIGATAWDTQTAYAATISVDGTTCTLADAITAELDEHRATSAAQIQQLTEQLEQAQASLAAAQQARTPSICRSM